MGPRCIYMDVGHWGSLEKERPKMTFGLLQHNAIALCTYFSDGTWRKFPISGKVRNEKYDFRGSLIDEFLTIMMIKKYWPDFSPKSDIRNRGYHILKLIPFPETSLLDERNRLIILIPDLHLHYFKDTYLDNFVTYYENKWDPNKRIPKLIQLNQRRSMETDFGFFLQSIIEFQRVGGKSFTTEVIVLGDTYEMWETHFILLLYGILLKNYDKDVIYRDLDQLKEMVLRSLLKLEWLGILGTNDKAIAKLKVILLRKLGELPMDSEFAEQVRILQKNDEVVSSLYISRGDLEGDIYRKAAKLASEILKKHHDQDGESFEKLFEKIQQIRWFRGNHDNFLVLSDLSPLDLVWVCPIDIDVETWRVGSPERSRRADIFYEHGHTFDRFNNDYWCGAGYWLTAVNALFEGKRRGDALKEFERLVTKGTDKNKRPCGHHTSTIENACKVFKYWEEKEKKETGYRPRKNKIMIHAHTHSPCMKDITSDYDGYKKEPEDSLPIIRPQDVCAYHILSLAGKAFDFLCFPFLERPDFEYKPLQRLTGRTE